MNIKNNILFCRWTAAVPAIVGTQSTVALGAASAASAASAISALDIISGVATAFGVLSDIRAGNEESDLNMLQAAEQDENAKIAALNAKVEENDAREKMIKTMAQNIAAGTSSGLDLSSGTITTGLGEVARKGNQEIDLKRTQGKIEVNQKVRQAQQLRMQASSSKRKGYTDAAFGVLDFARRQANRGSVKDTDGVAA